MNGICIRDLARIIRGELRLAAMPPLGGELEPVGRVVTDSREVQPGDLFWALRGVNHNGAHYAEEAFARGALGVVVAGRRVEPWPGKFSVEVEDSHWALWQLARTRRRAFPGRVIAVAGTEGATIAARMIDTVLGHSLTGTSAQVSPSDATSLPLAMLELEEDADYAVLEIAAASRGEIQSESHLCDPEIAVITSHAKCRTLNGDSTDVQRQVELGWDDELANGVSPNGWVVRHADSEIPLRSAKPRARQLWTGRGRDCDLMARHIECHGGQLAFDVDGTRITVRSAARHDLPAALAAFAVGRLLERTPAEIAEALASFRGVAGHGHEMRIRDRWVICDFATENKGSTFITRLEQLRDCSAPGRRIVLSDTRDESRATTRIADTVVSRCGADWWFMCGEQAAELAQAARQLGMPHGRAVPCGDVTEAARLIEQIWEPGDAVLIHGHQRDELQVAVETLAPKRATMKAA